MLNTLEIDVIDPGAALSMRGRLDARTTPAARARLHDEIDAGTGDLRIDLSGLEIWDGAGLGVLVGVSRRVQQCGRQLVLTGVGARELRLLRVARLTWSSAVHPAHPERLPVRHYARLRTGAPAAPVPAAAF